MKKIILSIMMVLILNMGAGAAFAAFTEVLPTPHAAEKSLLGAGNILETLYPGYTLVRIDDSIDQLWTHRGTTADVEALVKYAGYTQNFGFFNGGFNALVPVSANGYTSVSASFTVADSGNPFAFGDRAVASSTTSYLWSSLVSANSDAKDHMVTWQIIDPQSNVASYRYVVAFEDTARLGDKDYNDLVVEVNGVSPYNPVPEPMTMLLFGPALLGLVGLKKKKS